jgi:hypothetical protein
MSFMNEERPDDDTRANHVRRFFAFYGSPIDAKLDICGAVPIWPGDRAMENAFARALLLNGYSRQAPYQSLFFPSLSLVSSRRKLVHSGCRVRNRSSNDDLPD